MKSLFSIVIAMVLASAGLALADEEPPRPETLEELQAAVSAVLVENDVPAVGIAMVDADGPVWVDAIGKANLAQGIDADSDSMFRIGSTSKMFVALSVLKLVEEGRLSLDDKVADLAPDVVYENEWEDTDPIRVVHLLEHTTGWDDLHLPEYAHNDATPATLKEGLDYHPHSRVSRWKPGTRMSYCNSGPPVAAYILQRITGQDFEQYVAENFFEPIGMETMTYRLSADVEANGVTLYGNGNEPEDYWHIIMRPSGAINASATDMAKMVAFFIHRGEVGDLRLLSTDSIDRMEAATSTSGARAGLQTGYGLHNYSSTYENWIYREHNGGVNGGLAELAYLPDADVGHAIMINSGNFAAFNEISKLVRGFETRNLESPPKPQASLVDISSAQIAGLYHPINPRQQIGYFLDRVLGVQKLWVEDDNLMHKALLGGEPRKFLSVTPDLYRHDKTGAIVVARAEDPLAGPVVHIGTQVLTSVSPIVAYGQLGIGVLWGLSIATSILFLLVWGVRKLRGKVPAGPATRIRVWPLLAGLSILAVIGLFAVGVSDPFKQLGSPTFYSVGIMLLSIAFAVFAFLGVRTSVRERDTPMNRWAYWHSTIASSVHFVVAAYLLWFGAIGMMTWA